MLGHLSWPTLATRRRKARLTSFYKFHHGLTTINTRHLPTSSRPKRNTRQFHLSIYSIPSSRTAYRQKSYFPRTIPEWNSLPAETVSAPSLAAFQARVALL
eukprot:TRINITY_DN54986_c0_g1_i23.p1 TRINITY_DN54986_c0_g1~~TRINITY_DN54986_c0_g1_i23.p1  ORF type:complete len:101 (-),score=18.33 TRINITY_DN54986_c0_g1_i23:175-477(-)